MPRTRHPEIEPQVVVRGGDLLVHVWPEECDETFAPVATERPLGDGEAVLEVLAAADLEDVDVYAWRHARDAGAVLALTHHPARDLLMAALRVDGDLSPRAVLEALHGTGASVRTHLAS